MMNRSESIKEIATALAKAQGEMRGASKDAKNTHFNNHYADLASVWEACREALTKNGISVVQSPSTTGPVVSVTTLLMHASGEWISGECSATAKDAAAQSVGSAVTYLRRYGLAAMVGVAPEDDDGEGATNHARDNERAKRPPTSTEDKLSISEMLAAAKSKADLELVYQRAENELDAATWPRFEADYRRKYEALKKAAQANLRPATNGAPQTGGA